MRRLRALWFGWSHTTRVVIVLVPSFLIAMTVGIVLGVQNGYIDMTTPTYPPFTVQEQPWSSGSQPTSAVGTRSATLPPGSRWPPRSSMTRWSGREAGFSAATTASTPSSSTTTPALTSSPTSTATTQSTPDPTDPLPSTLLTGTTSTVPEPTGGHP